MFMCASFFYAIPTHWDFTEKVAYKFVYVTFFLYLCAPF